MTRTRLIVGSIAGALLFFYIVVPLVEFAARRF